MSLVLLGGSRQFPGDAALLGSAPELLLKQPAGTMQARADGSDRAAIISAISW
jgi:hypothetical protein